MCSNKGQAGQIVEFSSLDAKIQDLLRRGAEARENAYCPYSNFKVGSAIISSDGTIYTGCNVENCAHGSICAERTAIVKAVSEGKLKFTTVAVVASLRDEFVAPCGTCRQFISEFGSNTEIYLAMPNLRKVLVTSIKELMPLAFFLNGEQ